MKNLYAISGVTGMTGSELSCQFVTQDHKVIGFDNFFISSINTVKDIVDNPSFIFYNYDINCVVQTDEVCEKANTQKVECDGRLVVINCVNVVHTKHFYEVESTCHTNVFAMKGFLERVIAIGTDTYINCSTSEVYSMQSWNDNGDVLESDYLARSFNVA